jgi:hypothetical protein
VVLWLNRFSYITEFISYQLISYCEMPLIDLTGLLGSHVWIEKRWRQTNCDQIECTLRKHL